MRYRPRLRWRMATLDNPAGRLHTILSRYAETSTSNVSILSTWAQTLHVEGDELLLAIAQVAGILGDLEELVRKVNRPAVSDVFDRNLRAWSTPILLHGYPVAQTPSVGPDLVDSDALAALNLLADNLEQYDEAQLPTPEDLKIVRTQIEEALGAVRDDKSLPVQLRVLMASRLTDIIWAIDHVSLAGPDGVGAALERLAGALLFNRAPHDNPMIKRIVIAVQVAWAVFTKGESARASITAWTNLFSGDGPPAIGS